MTTEKKPRSIRLTQAHRTDIVKAVMAEWDNQNAAPEAPFIGFLTALVNKQLKSKAKRPGEDTFAAIVAMHTKVADALATIPDADNLLSPRKQQYVHIYVKDEQGNTATNWVFEIPASLAHELGLPYREVLDHHPNCGPVASWLTEDDKAQSGATRLASFYSKKQLNILIDVSDPLYRKYKKDVRTVNAHEKERRTVKSELEDFLSQFNTTNQIREGWPEMVQYLPAHLADPEAVIKLPQLAVSRLNERLGLGASAV